MHHTRYITHVGEVTLSVDELIGKYQVPGMIYVK